MLGCFGGLGPEGRLGTSDVSPLSGIPGLRFDSTFLSAVLFICLDLLLLLSSPFFCFRPILLPTFHTFVPTVFALDRPFSVVVVVVALFFKGFLSSS